MERLLWHRQENEPPIWFARFNIYLQVGAHRTIEEAFRRCKAIEGFTSRRPGNPWYDKSERWNWLARAEAYDQHQRDSLQQEEAKRRIDAREQRLQIISDGITSVVNAIAKASLTTLTEEQAREALPTLRMWMRDLLTAQRIEIGLPVTVASTNAPAFTADDLAAAQAELRDWYETNANG